MILFQLLALVLAALLQSLGGTTQPSNAPPAAAPHSGWVWVPEHYKRGRKIRGHWRRM